MKYDSTNMDFGLRLTGNSNYCNFTRGIVVSKHMVVELEQGDRARGESFYS